MGAGGMGGAGGDGDGGDNGGCGGDSGGGSMGGDGGDGGGGGDGSGGEGGGQGGASSSMTRVLGVLLPEYWKIPGKSARELPNNVSSPRMYMLAPCCMHSDLRTVGTSWGALVERSAQGSVQECKHAQRLPC